MQPKRKFLKISAWVIGILLLLAVGARVALAPLASTAINQWFEQQGLQSEIGALDFDLGDGGLVLSGLQVRADAGTVLQLEQARIGWSWRALDENQLRIEFIDLEGLEFDIEQGPQGRLVVAGIDLNRMAAESEQAQPAADEAGEPLQWTLLLQHFGLERFKLCYRNLPKHDYCSEFESFSWDGDVLLDLARLHEASLPLMVKGGLKLVKPVVHHNLLQRNLLSLDELAMQQISIDTLDAIGVESIAIDALAFLERAGQNEQPQITFVEALEIDDLDLQQMSHLDIAEIRVREHEAILVNLEDRGLEINEWFEAVAAEQAGQAESPAPEPEKPFTFALGKLSYQTAKSLRYQDQSLQQPFAADLNSIDLEIEQLDSRKPGQPSQLKYSAKLGEHGRIDIDGSITPLAEKLSFDMSGKISGLDLRAFSAITAAKLGHNIKSGQLDADLVLRAEQDILDSMITLTLNQFSFKALSKADQEKMDSGFGFPLNSTLSLLRDRDNRIVLEIPMTGDLRNPDVGPEDAVRQAISSAISTAVLAFYTPLGLAAPLAGGMLDLATALKFEPVVFERGSSDRDDAETGELGKIITLLQEKPEVAVTLCGFTNSDDRRTLFPRTSGDDADDIELDAKQLQKLGELGEERVRAVKNYLVGKEIDPSRLIPCAAEHVEGEGVAGVEISL